MTPTDLQRLKEICEKATDGPWVWDSYNTAFTVDGSKEILSIPDHPSDGHYEPDQIAERSAWYRESENNINFACAARTALPALIAEVERLRLEASVWRRLLAASDDYETGILDQPQASVFIEAKRRAEDSGDFIAASKLLDEAGYKEE